MFHSIIKESLKNTNLRKIRIKTDPSKVANHEDFKDIEGYEGYILSEGLNSLRVLVLAPDMPIMDIPPEALEHIYHDQHAGIFESFKNYCVQYLKNKNAKINDPVFKNIENTNDYGEIESFLKQYGLTEGELNDLYREFIDHE